MTAQQHRKTQQNGKHSKSGGSAGCFSITLLVLLLFFVIGSLVIIFCTTFLSDTIENFEKMQYPKKYNDIVSDCSTKYSIDENLIYAVIRTESGFDSEAESPVGAKGLMQIMPETFTWLMEKQDCEGKYTEDDLENPEVSIEFGTYYLRILLDHFEDENCAVAAYNAGFVVEQWLEDSRYSKDGITLDYIPYEETSNYVNKVESAKQKYEDLY